MALEITDNNFKEILAEGSPVVIDFWAPWCAPCRMVAPIMFCYSYCIPRFLICPTASVRRYPAIYLIYHMREMRFLSLFLFCKRKFFVLPTFRCSAGYIGCYFCFFSTPKIAIKEHRSRNIG